MRIQKSQFRMTTHVVMCLALGCLIVSGLRANPQSASSTKAGSKEELEHLIYSIKGPDLFRAHCAACHGLDAKGDGPMAAALKTKPANLTALAKNNGGKFPSARVSRTIVGGDIASSHGSREMPIWGPIFHQIEDDQDFGDVRLQNLVKYLESIQLK